MAFSIPIPKFFRSKELIGVDIGSQNIRIVKLKHSGNKWTLVNLVKDTIPQESISSISPEERKSVIIDKLKKLISSARVDTKKTCSSISGGSVIIRYVVFPKLSPQELSQTIAYEAEPYIPFSINEVNLGFHIVGDVEEEGQKKMETILVASKKEFLREHIEILRAAGLQPTIIDIDALALSNSLEVNNYLPSDATVLALNIGASLTNLIIVENGILKIARDIFIGGNNFTQAVQQTMGVDFATAEEMKKTYGLITPQEKTIEAKDEKFRVGGALASVYRDLVFEIQRSIDYYLARSPEKSIYKVYLTGGSAVLKNIDANLSNELHLPVEVFNPLSNIEVAPHIQPFVENIESAVQLSVAIGLGLRREGDA
jgi:type IV pilus assembly protein PilM